MVMDPPPPYYYFPDLNADPPADGGVDAEESFPRFYASASGDPAPPDVFPDLNADPPADVDEDRESFPRVYAGDVDGLDEEMLFSVSNDRKRLRGSRDDDDDGEGEARGAPRRCCDDCAEADESQVLGQEVDMAAAQSAGYQFAAEDDHVHAWYDCSTMTGDGSAYAEDEEPEFRHFRRQGAGMAAQGFGQRTPAAMPADDEQLQEQRADMAAAGSERGITVEGMIDEQLLEQDFTNKAGDDPEMEVQAEDELDEPTSPPFIQFL